MLKKDARKQFRAERMQLSSSQLTRYDDLLLIRFQAIVLPPVSAVLSFWPIAENHEPNTFPITDFMQFRIPDLRVCYPVCDPGQGSMRAILTGEDTVFEEKTHHVQEPVRGEEVEPEQLDLVLVPLLALDQQGFRVGYGKGYYDRFLARCRPDCLKMGLSYFEPIPQIEDRDQFDVPLNLCITPNTTYVF